MSSYWAFNGGVLASDAERDRTVVALRRHYADGRLDEDELERRVERAVHAKYRSELRALQRDLPLTMPIDKRRVARGMNCVQRAVYRLHAACFVGVNTTAVSVWAWSGGEEFWPALTLIPGGALLLWHRRGSRRVSRRLERQADAPQLRGRRALSV